MRKIVMIITATAVLSSCVSKKKYVALEQNLGETKSELQKTAVERDDLKAKVAGIEARVDAYYEKINTLKEEVDSKMSLSEDGTLAVSNKAKEQMRASLSNLDSDRLRGANTLKDSMNLAIAYNLTKSLSADLQNDEDIDIQVDRTVVMISISDKMLFNSGSFRVSNKANEVLGKIAEVINSEPSLEIMVEGHTDARTINTPCMQDNWDLSVKRATSIVRKLQTAYKVDPSKMIASGRSSYVPLTSNDNEQDRARNRRTRIVILPNLDKFLALMAQN